VSSGQTALLVGTSGCGKTTLLKAINGLIPWLTPFSVRGSVLLDHTSIDDLDPGQRSHLMGTCLDRPENQLFLPRAEDEVEHAFRRYRTREDFKEMVLEEFNLKKLLSRRSSEMSSGERQRIALATSLFACPRPVLFDEPSAHLDDDGMEALLRLTRFCNNEGGMFLISEHAPWRWRENHPEYLHLNAGQISSITLPEPDSLPRPKHSRGEEVILSTKHLSAGRSKTEVIHNLDLDIHAGEIVLISGKNGAGKSTLARTLAGWMKPLSGKMIYRKNRKPALMLPESELQLFGRTVQEELTPFCASMAELARVLRRHRIEHLAARPPWILSRGEQQRLVHASHDLQRPDVLIIDEPAQGLGQEDLKTLIRLIHRRAEKGRAYMLISNRIDLRIAAHRCLYLEDGHLEERP
jgi:energy-coupling factor transport system ATP-binding protein